MNVVTRLFQLEGACADLTLFQGEGFELTARHLFERVNLLASHLRKQEIGPGSSVAIYLPRGVDAAITIYAVLYSGARYVPIDGSSPNERISIIIQDSQARCVIGDGARPEWLERTAQYINISDIQDQELPSGKAYVTDSEDIAAILYTSGSTGRPKGVAISHRAISAFSDWGQRVFNLTSKDRIANLAPFHFDLSLFDLFVAPNCGATTLFIPDELKLAPARLTDWLQQNRITTWYTVPSILAFIAMKGGLDKKSLPDLRQVLFAGERFHTQKVMNLTQLLDETAFYNLFGPTETNVCLFWPVERKRLAAEKAIPAGVPAGMAEIRVDPANSELLVKGPCLMSGYWKNREVDLPLDAAGWFQTGDRVSMNAMGEYEFHGRLDRMIKTSGYRVEPAEVEQVLNLIENVASTAVMGIPDPAGGTRIAAALAGVDIDLRAVKKHVNKHLPPYMRPSIYHLMDKMPVVSNGKTDYQCILKAIEGS